MAEFFQYIAAGGDVAVFGLLAILWRFDRRLLKVEMFVCPHANKAGRAK
jgi:hypothetical protein